MWQSCEHHVSIMWASCDIHVIFMWAFMWYSLPLTLSIFNLVSLMDTETPLGQLQRPCLSSLWKQLNCSSRSFLCRSILWNESLRKNSGWLMLLACSNWKGWRITPPFTGKVSLGGSGEIAVYSIILSVQKYMSGYCNQRMFWGAKLSQTGYIKHFKIFAQKKFIVMTSYRHFRRILHISWDGV